MSVILWLLMMLLGGGFFLGSSVGENEAQVEVESGSGESSAAIAPEPTEVPENGFADPFPDLGVLSTNAEIQERYMSRWTLPSCGFIDLATDAGEDNWQCLQGAVGSKEGAELVVLDLDARPVTTTTYRVNPDGPMEIFVDASEKPGTQPTWEYRQCQPSKDLRAEPCAS